MAWLDLHFNNMSIILYILQTVSSPLQCIFLFRHYSFVYLREGFVMNILYVADRFVKHSESFQTFFQIFCIENMVLLEIIYCSKIIIFGDIY